MQRGINNGLIDQRTRIVQVQLIENTSAFKRQKFDPFAYAKMEKIGHAPINGDAF